MAMKTLTIFYDPHCGLCSRFREWLEAQPQRVTIRFTDFRSEEASRRFPGLRELGAERDVVVLADDGRWWQGAAAWLTCLWATREYRNWAFRMAAPALLPFVKKAVHLLSENRLTLSRLMKLQTDVALASAILSMPEAECETSKCHL